MAEATKMSTTSDIRKTLELVLCMIINPAPLVAEDREGEVEAHRGNTPWYIYFPNLNCTVMVTDEDGNPRVGYYSDREAENQAATIWNAMRENPEIRANMVNNGSFPELRTGYKVMYRDLYLAPMPK
jgi:hypothetical protein